MVAAWPLSSRLRPPGRPAAAPPAAGGRAGLGGGAVQAGGRVVAVRPLPSAWLANHAVDVADAAGRSTGWCCALGPAELGGRGPRLPPARRPSWGCWPHPGAGAGAGRRRPGRRRLRRARPAAGRLPGAPPDLAGDPAPLVEGLAAALPSVHAMPGPGPVPPYRRFYDPEQLPPTWSDRPALWERAFAVAAGPPPDDRACFIHRDYHPGNTLWAGGRLTGVVDWTGGVVGAAIGRPRAHAGQPGRGPGPGRCRGVPGRPPGPDRVRPPPYWDVASAVGCAPRWRSTGAGSRTWSRPPPEKLGG